MRGELKDFLGDAVGNQVATVFDTWVNANEGVLKGAVGTAQAMGELDPRWFLLDPKGASATWTDLVKSGWKGSLINAFLNPQEAGEANLQQWKSLLHLDDWSTARPGLGFGENAFDVATLFIPVGGEAGAAADGAGAAARGAEAAADAAGTAGRAGERAAGGVAGLAGGRGALADVTRAGGDLTKDLEGVTGNLPKIEPPPGGRPVGLPAAKAPEAPIESRVESAPRPPDPAAGAPHGPAPAPVASEPPAAPRGPREPGGGPPPHAPSGGAGELPPEPATAARAPASAGATPAEQVRVGAHSPQPAPPAPISAAPRWTPPEGRPPELSTSSLAGTHGLGDGGTSVPHPPGRAADPSGPHQPGQGGSHGGNLPTPSAHDPTPHDPHGDGAHHGLLPDGSDHPSHTVNLKPDDLSALADYTGSGYMELNDALRSSALDASQHARIEAVNAALEKLPPYRGTVIRGTNLPPDVLAQYRPGEVIIEDAFLSTTSNPAVARSPSFTGNVEFMIVSDTGRDISAFSTFPFEREILFPAGTSFYVVSKVVDPVTGKTIIRMIER